MPRITDIFRSRKDSADAVGGSSFTPTAFDAPGFSFNTVKPEFSGGRGTLFQLRPTGSPTQDAFAERFPRSLRDLDTLRESVRPGASALRESLLGQVEASRRRAIGNLQENLQRRRVLGSSFGADALSRAEAEFSQQAQQAEAQAAIFEIEATGGALAQETELLLNAKNQELQLLGITAGVAQSMTALSAQSQMQTQALRVQAIQADEQISLQSAQFQHNMIMDIANSVGAGVAASSRTLKEDFEDVDVLDALTKMPVQRWSYRDDPEDRSHIGPMAEDVFVTLGVGDGKALPLSDMLGVTLRAVQQLAHEVRALKEEIAR